MRIPKEVIREGQYAYVTADGKVQTLTATPEHIKYWHQTGNAMRAANLPIPVPFEHDPSAHPMTPADRLRNNAGEVIDFELGSVVDERGVTRSALFSNVEISDARAAEKIKDSTIRWTSPWFTSFTDGSGKKWDGVIGHVALTSRPRIVNQQPFQAAFSLTPQSVPPNQFQGICLSRAGLVSERHPGSPLMPDYPLAFSLWTGAKFAFPDKEEGGGDEKPKKKDKEGGDEKPPKSEGGDEEGGEEGGNPFGKEGGEEGAKPKFDPMTGEAVKEPLIDPDGDVGAWTVIADWLSMLLGVDFGDDVTEENGLERIYEICREAMKAKMAESAEPPLDESAASEDATGTTPPPANPIIQEQQPMYMSLEQAKAIQDPVMKSIALSLVQAQTEAASEKKKGEAIRQKLFRDAGQSRSKRIAALTRHMGPEQKKQLEDLAAGAQFSLGDDGSISDPIDSWLSLLERQQMLLPTLLKTPSAELSVMAQPRETTGAVTDERLEEVRKEYRRNAGLAS